MLQCLLVNLRALYRLSAPPTPTTPRATASASAARPHAGCTTTAVGSSTRSVITAGTSAEGIPVSAAAARKITTSNAICSASTCPVAKAGASSPIARTASSRAVAWQIAALPSNLLPRAGLAIGERIAPRRATKSICGRAVSIRSAAAVFGIVLPVAASTTIRWQRGRAIPAATTRGQRGWAIRATRSTNSASPTDSTDTTGPANATSPADSTDTANSTDAASSANSARPTEVAAISTACYWIRGARADVRVAVEVVVVVDIDIIVAAPSAAPTPTATPKGPHHDADTKGNCYSRGVVSRRRIIDGRVRVYRRTVDDDGIIRRHIYDLRIRLLDHDHTLVLDGLGFHLLLLSRLQIALILGFLAHALHGIHDVALLRQKRIA